FALLNAAEAPAPAVAPPAAAYPEWLKAAWLTRDEWWKEPWPRVPPALLRQLEKALLKAERRLKDGADQDAVKQGVQKRLDDLRREREKERERQLQLRASPASLAREAARGRQPDPAAAALLPKYRDLLALEAR